MNEQPMRLIIARSDVAFLHDTLMACTFQGPQMIRAAGIVNDFARVLREEEARDKQAEAAKPEQAKAPAPAAKAPEVQAAPPPSPVRQVIAGQKNRKRK